MILTDKDYKELSQTLYSQADATENPSIVSAEIERDGELLTVEGELYVETETVQGGSYSSSEHEYYKEISSVGLRIKSATCINEDNENVECNLDELKLERLVEIA